MAAVPENLAGLSRIMAALSGIGFVLCPLLLVAAFLIPGGHTDWILGQHHLRELLRADVPYAFRVAALLFEAGPTGFVMWALWSLRRLFQRYAAGDVFSNEALNCLNHVAAALFAEVITGFVVQAPVSLLLTWWRGEGHREIALGLSSGDFGSLFLAGAMLVIARVMAVARRMADENESFV
jgi:hypothetical protein